jgi:diacylglycerol kinase family enzyme
VASQYGDNRFESITLSAALADTYFNYCNNYMLNGEYSHFINHVAQPVQAVSFFTNAGQNNYKILYSGSGGGLMMSIISITMATKALQLSSFVPIGTSNVVANCAQYGETLACQVCVVGYHL